MVQVVLEGQNALTKLKELVGNRDPSKCKKSDKLRAYYGVDRLDNAYFISETVYES